MTQPLMDWKIAPAGMQPVLCSMCGVRFTAEEVSAVYYTHLARCKCGYIAERCNVILEVAHESAQFLDADTTRETIWYHSTFAPDWMARLEEGEKEAAEFFESMGEDDLGDPTAMVHIGTRAAAIDRALDLSQDMRKNWNLDERDLAEGVYLYAVRILPETEIDEIIHTDDNDDAPVTVGNCADFNYSTGANRYVNRYESPGSISVLVNRRGIEIISVEKIS